MATNSALIMKFQSSPFHLKPTLFTPPLNLPFPISRTHKINTQFRQTIKVDASANGSSRQPIIQNLRTTAAAIVFAASMIGKFQTLPARAEPQQVLTQEITIQDEKTLQDSDFIESRAETQEVLEEDIKIQEEKSQEDSPISEFLESNSEAIEALKKLLEQKLESGEDEESLKILKDLVTAQPENQEWKILMARILNQMGETQKARSVLEEILSKNPLSIEALFENALLMDQIGEGKEVIRRLEEALRIADEENKAKESVDVRLIIAQIQFLQKNVEEALRNYEELVREDPNDFRPYFCKGMIYSLLNKDEEARENFAKYRELSPSKIEVEGNLRMPLSRMKPFGTGNEENLS